MTTVRYFAYGSNMQSATFRGRRAIEPHSARAARVRGWRLVFDKPPLLPIGESFANIVADPAGEVLGVVYEIAAEDHEHIELTEGVRIGNYDRLEVAAEMLGEPHDVVSVLTLATTQSDPTLRPTERYISLLVDGAIEHGLPESYVAWLRTIPTCTPTAESLELRARIDEAFRLLRSDPHVNRRSQ